ncbi:GNAT family N-acetyltransferase [Paenibacillus sp. BC26]|uniref:GNAT family N-acetyltransferase n=1 Tax=Paenibacillus sp. BC26 TaxID=1881032 RepID=UPI0008F420E1|nr:GNAT family N-acetyltransferase [Paenibacillus sp. BC26]SFS74565.1 ribosomal-protein-alanine N-acetyltransferase [Paenibacillus sp. BC26]
MFIVTTERLTLLPISTLNANDFLAYIQDKKHIGRYIEQLKLDPTLLGWGVWLVTDTATREVLGDIGFKGKPTGGIAEVGYGFTPSARNQGYATESVRALLDWAFSTGQAATIVAECLADNHASINVLKKLGMKQTDEQDGMLYWTLSA